MFGRLNSLDHHGDWLRIGPSEFAWAHAGEPETLPLLGLYSEHWAEPVAFYRWEGGLRLRLGDEVIGLVGCAATWEVHAERALFRLKRGDQLVAARAYTIHADLQQFRDGDTPFAEAEDFDLLLLVTNVLGDAARRERVFRSG